MKIWYSVYLSWPRPNLGQRLEPEKTSAHANTPGVWNKSIALEHCYNVILRDISILEGGHFAILATGVDNLTIDNLKIDTNRDGMDIDCCRNVRVSNCTVDSPWDDGICPKSSFDARLCVRDGECDDLQLFRDRHLSAAGYADRWHIQELGTWLQGRTDWASSAGTESNGGFNNITISTCVFESCRGFALETVDGTILEDITFVGVTMRDIRNSPLFLRLGTRMRGPKDVAVGTLKRVLISNVISNGAIAELPSIISGVPGYA